METVPVVARITFSAEVVVHDKWEAKDLEAFCNGVYDAMCRKQLLELLGNYVFPQFGDSVSISDFKTNCYVEEDK